MKSWIYIFLTGLLMIGTSSGRRQHHNHRKLSHKDTSHSAGEEDEIKAWLSGTKSEDDKPSARIEIRHRKLPRDQSSHHSELQSSQSWSDNIIRPKKYHKTEQSNPPPSCATTRCNFREVCVINAYTHKPQCLKRHHIRLRILKNPNSSKDKKNKKNSNKTSKTIQKIKPSKPQHGRHHHGHKTTPSRPITHSKATLIDPPSNERYHKKVKTIDKSANSVLITKTNRVCNGFDLHEMGRRLLDWFKLLQDTAHQQASLHHMNKRNSKKKELRDDCECLAPVSWQFSQLDDNSDGHLSTAELRHIESNNHEHCLRPFFDYCDLDRDTTLSEKEWCCCFKDIKPPCQAAEAKVPSQEIEGKLIMLPGTFIPSCDEDGFFNHMQCHSSTGQCWCVDRNGHELNGSRRFGTTDCSNFHHPVYPGFSRS